MVRRDGDRGKAYGLGLVTEFKTGQPTALKVLFAPRMARREGWGTFPSVMHHPSLVAEGSTSQSGYKSIGINSAAS